jgi:hypothetical protein
MNLTLLKSDGVHFMLIGRIPGSTNESIVAKLRRTFLARLTCKSQSIAIFGTIVTTGPVYLGGVRQDTYPRR